jgi:protein involved in polysaccharide export with SLBB domain
MALRGMLTFLFVLALQVTTPQPPIAVGDRLWVVVQTWPRAIAQVTVDADGNADIVTQRLTPAGTLERWPLAKLRVAGLTPGELRDRLEAIAAKEWRYPVVTVGVTKPKPTPAAAK